MVKIGEKNWREEGRGSWEESVRNGEGMEKGLGSKKKQGWREVTGNGFSWEKSMSPKKDY